MILRHRRPDIYGLMNREGSEKDAEKLINDLLNREYKIIFLPSGSAAVFLSMWIAKIYSEKIFIPDMEVGRDF